jgi:hypothetical protein
MSTADVFHVESVEPCAVPRGITQGDWCRYVVSGGSARIVGRYRGSLPQARKNAEGFVRSLNDRASNKKSVWAPRARSRRRSR